MQLKFLINRFVVLLLVKSLVLLLAISNVSASSHELSLHKKSFNSPLIIAFMGIPASGKSTIATELANLVDAKLYLEGEETNYPDDVKEGFLNRERKGVALKLYKYFRKIRLKHIRSAVINKQQGKSSILDCFFDKLFYDMLDSSGMDWIIDPKHADFGKIKQIAYKDKNNLPDVDVIVFLKISEDLHKTLQHSRGRKFDLDSKIFTAQEAFLDATHNYAKTQNKTLIIINQERDVYRVATKILSRLDPLLHGSVHKGVSATID